MRRIILASASPRRRQLLEQIGLEFEVEPSDYAEDLQTKLQPHELAKELSLKKAQAVAKRYEDAVIIAADTLIVLEDGIMGKPHTEAEAKEILAALNGRPHSVITGFTLLDTKENKRLSKSVETTVYVKRLSPAEIDAYVGTGEPLDKAGAYGIQGLGAVIVERIEGDYFNVIGLPLCALAEGLKSFGVPVL